jgi:hypothetical protein
MAQPVVTGQKAQLSTHTKALIQKALAPKASPNKATPKQARAAVAAAQLVAPGLTAGQLASDTNAAANLKYGDAQRNLQAQPARTNDWFSQYQQAIAAAQTQQQANYAGANQTVTGLQQGLNNAAQQQWAGQQSDMAASAAQRGATVDPALAGQAHNAANTRNDVTGAFGAMLASQGANENAALGNRKVTASQQGLEAQGVTQSALRQLLLDKGSFKQTYRDTELSNAAKTALENALTSQQIGSTAATTQKTIAQTGQTKATTAKTQVETKFVQKYGYLPGTSSPTDQAKLAYYNKHGYFPPTGPPKAVKPGAAGQPASGPGSLTRSKEQDYLSQINTVAGYFQKPPVVNGKPLTLDQINQMLTTGKNPLKKAIDPRVINVARSLASNGGKGLGPWGVKNAHALGVHVNGNFQVLTPATMPSGGRPGGPA